MPIESVHQIELNFVETGFSLIYNIFASLLLLLAALPTLMVIRNLPLFHRAARANNGIFPPVSVLIPARDEQHEISQAVEAVLNSTGIAFEVIVLDDHSIDRTAAIVSELAIRDARVRLALAPELPTGWNGKQHACWHLAQLAQYDHLLFIDADVRVTEDALTRLAAEFDRCGCALLSGFPRQITISLAERLLIPMMHFVLLGYLPLDRMRASSQPEFGAGCGQMFLTCKSDYLTSGGHAAIRQSRHDGLQLPRSYRRAGLKTDLFDGSDIASVRMYSGWSSLLQGLQKNATEGIANARLIGIFSFLLLGSAVLPVLTLAHAIFYDWPRITLGLLCIASLLSYAPRALLAARLQQSWLGVALHPLAVAIFIAVQWLAFIRQASGRSPIAWKGRL